MGEALRYEQPTKYLVTSKEYAPEYEIPVLTAGQTFILGYTRESSGIYPASSSNPVIIFDDFTTANKWVDFPFKAKSSAMKMLTTTNASFDLRYMYYVLQTVTKSPSEHSRQWISTFANIDVPVPDLEEQKRIASILSNFELLVSDMKVGIPAEIQTRRQQYGYYRDKLLTFEELKAS